MIRMLMIIAGASLVLTLLCLGGAAAIANQDLVKRGLTLEQFFERWEVDAAGERENGPRITREIAWQGAADEIVIAHGGSVRYAQGAQTKVVVTGPAEEVNKLIMIDGRLREAAGGEDEHGAPLSSRLRLDVEITAPSVESFALFGAARLTIADFDRPRLRIEINGHGDVAARGKADEVEVIIKGSGDVDVADVANKVSKVEIMGSGDVRIAPADVADIEIKGSGDVDLLSNPAKVRTDIKGSGDVERVERDDEDGAPAAGAAPAAPAAQVETP